MPLGFEDKCPKSIRTLPRSFTEDAGVANLLRTCYGEAMEKLL